MSNSKSVFITGGASGLGLALAKQYAANSYNVAIGDIIDAQGKMVSKEIEADSVSLLNVMTDKAFLSENNFDEATALGMYLPNSYEFFWNTSAEKFRDRMLAEYKRFWNASRIEKAHAIGLSPNQVIALASIVYEESKQATEQPRIAGVYLNRIKNGWRIRQLIIYKQAVFFCFHNSVKT